MSLSIAELQPVLHDLFTTTAEDLARETGFCQRRRQLTGPIFAQTIVFSLLDKPDATLEDFSDNANDLFDIDVSAQAFDQRFNEAATCFFQELLLAAFDRAFSSLHSNVLPLLRRFPGGVHVRDGTTVSLPACLAAYFPGCGGANLSQPDAAAVKLVFDLDVTSGLLDGLSILNGRDNEKTAEVAAAPLPQGALLLEDMGFFAGERLQHYDSQGVYFLTRIPVSTTVFSETGKRLNLEKLLDKFKGGRLDMRVQVIAGRMFPCRLLAVRLPEEEAEKRRAAVREEARRRGRRVSAKKLALCEWNILVTNVPAEMLSAEEACVVRRVRWQVELLFKVFKSEGRIDETRSDKPWRVMSELYAKLLGQIVSHWLLLSAGFVVLWHSARKAARQVSRKALAVVAVIGNGEELRRLIGKLTRLLKRHCQLKCRNRPPSTYDRLAAFDPPFRRSKKCA